MHIARIRLGLVLSLPILGILLVLGSSQATASSLSTTTLVTKGIDNAGADNWAVQQQAGGQSYDGRYTVFSSESTNLVPNDTNEFSDIFLYDRITGRTDLISHSISGGFANGNSYAPTISADGRYVSFASEAGNIMAGLPSSCYFDACDNLYVYDRQTKRNKPVNLNNLGLRIPVSLRTLYIGRPMISANGQFVVFSTETKISPQDNNYWPDIMVRDLHANMTRAVSIDNNGDTGVFGAEYPTISADGRYVSFRSASEYGPEDHNNWYDIYVRDIQEHTLTLVSKNAQGKAPKGNTYTSVISADGRNIVYWSDATDIVLNDTNRGTDIFLYDVQKKTNKRINMTTKGKEAYGSSFDPVISADGSYIVYGSYADITGKNHNGLEDIYIYYKNLGITKQVNRASHNGAFPTDSSCHSPSISGDGKAITYLSSSEELTTNKVDPWKNNLYLDYNPVVAVPYYDPNDILDILNP